MRFLLDEDMQPGAAETARGLGVDVSSVHGLGRLGLSDEEQLRRAAADSRVFVTRNRNDFLALTVQIYHRSEAHAVLLIVTLSLPNSRPEALAHAIEQWPADHKDDPDDAMRYRVDFLSELSRR